MWNTKKLRLLGVDEIVPLCTNALNSVALTTDKVTDWLENDTRDEGFEILIGKKIICHCRRRRS